jgi:hypothetical protein
MVRPPARLGIIPSGRYCNYSIVCYNCNYDNHEKPDAGAAFPDKFPQQGIALPYWGRKFSRLFRAGKLPASAWSVVRFLQRGRRFAAAKTAIAGIFSLHREFRREFSAIRGIWRRRHPPPAA